MSSEAPIQRLILSRLPAIPGVHAWRSNVGAVEAPGRFVRFGVKGQADITGVLITPSGIGQRLEIECKAPGKYPTPAQREFRALMLRMGALHVVAYKLDDALVPIVRAIGREPRSMPGDIACWCCQPASFSAGLCTYHGGLQGLR